MMYLRTKLATNFADVSRNDSFADKVLHFVETSFEFLDANPDYDYSAVREWLVEFDDAGWPAREIGLGLNGVPVLAGPDERNYGYWHDTNMKLEDFDGTPITAAQFEECWNAWKTDRQHDGIESKDS